MYYAVMQKRSVVAERIEDLLRIKGMSLTDLSRASHVDISTISNILSGKRKNPRSDTVEKIARGFPTSPDYLNGHTKDWSPNDAPPLPDYAAEVVESMRHLDRGRNYELLVIAKSFVSASEDIRQLTRQEFIDLLVETGDQLGNQEDTNRIMEILQRLERKWNGSDDDDDGGSPPAGDDAPQLPSGEPS